MLAPDAFILAIVLPRAICALRERTGGCENFQQNQRKNQQISKANIESETFRD